MTNEAFIGVGSNIEPERNLPRAVRFLAETCKVQAVSAVWETAPVGFEAQPSFLNAAIAIQTPSSAIHLKQNILRRIEQLLGRVRTADSHGPRTIDLDLLLFNDLVLNAGDFTVPDPDILLRPFVAIPLAELAPERQHPITGDSMASIAASFEISPKTMRARPDVVLVATRR